MPNILIYGANGYTGRLIIEEAIARGHRPTLAGRSPEKIEPLGKQYDLPTLVFGLEHQTATREALQPFDVVIHAAGPFMHTATPMQEACIATGTHYVDITGEIEVFAASYRRHQAALDAGVCLLPGGGFDVVPTDCLANHVARRLPTATELALAFDSLGRPSAGTTSTMIESLPKGGGQSAVRRGGKLVPQKLGLGMAGITFSHGKRRMALPIPWGDLETAWRSTRIPNITVYMAQNPKTARRMQRWSGTVAWLMKNDFLRRMALGYVRRNIKGPDLETRQTAKSYFWAEAKTADGQRVEAWMETIEAYTLTAVTAVMLAERICAAGPEVHGFQTPAKAFGADFILDVPGTVRYDALPAQQ